MCTSFVVIGKLFQHLRRLKNQQTLKPVRSNAYSQKGFTLIELLVVVLIIGVLSAIALPQYDLAVKKARFASLFPIVEALGKAQEVFYMTNGHYAAKFSALDIQPPGGGEITLGGDGNERVQYKDFYCRLFNESVYCHGVNYGYYSLALAHHPSNPNARFCVVESTLGDAQTRRKMCRSLGGVKVSDGQFEFWHLP